MKVKFFLVYVLAGAAFLAVSLWVWLSRGTNPKAIKAKYKLGGIMLVAWSIIATASCERGPLSNIFGGNDGEIMCYDPVPSNYASFYTERWEQETGYALKTGETLTVVLVGVDYKDFRIAINCRVAGETGEESIGALLQTEDFAMEGNSSEHQVKYAPSDPTFTGQAVVRIWGLREGDGEAELLFSQPGLYITGGED